MARLDYLGKNLGRRILLLLFWTIFFCCVLYASRGDKHTDAPPSSYFKDLSSTRLKRISKSSTMQLVQDSCKLGTPTLEDHDVLRRMFSGRRRRAGKPQAVHCSVVSPSCDGDRKFLVDCHSSGCSAFKVRVKEGNHVTPSLSDEELSDIVGTGLRENSFMTVEDLNRYIDVHCQDPAVSELELTGDIISGPKCNTPKTQTGDQGKGSDERGPKKNIHLLYFRFLSHWEFPVRFPGLLSLLEDAAKHRRMNVLTFDKHQATKWGDDETLSALLQGHAGPFNAHHSLLDSLGQAGYCFRLEDLSCSRSREQEILVANVTSAGDITCEDHPLRHREAIMERLCTEGNLTDTRTRSVLTSLLSKVHDLEGVGVDPRPVFSVSVLNTKDFPNAEVLDNALRNFFTGFLLRSDRKDRVAMVLSGVGNPAFLRFDQNARLQSQASNPATVLISTGEASAASYGDTAQHLNRTLFSMPSVHEFLKRLIGKEDRILRPKADSLLFGVDESDGPRTNSSLLFDVSDSDGPGTGACEHLNVEPPFTCLCEDQYVEYENDTLMAGFAAFAVSVLNARLQRQEGPALSSDQQKCAHLSGVSFADVRVGLDREKRRILMELSLENELSKDRVLRGAALDLWDTDKIPRAEIWLYKPGSFSSSLSQLPVQTDRFLKTLCRTEESLEFNTASETSLLKRWSQERHFGRKGTVLHVHDNCLFMFVRDFGDSVSVEAANVCRDRHYEVMLHLSLMNMISLSPLPLSVSLGHVQREFLTAIVKISYTVPTFAYKLHPDFDVSYDN